MCTYWKQHTHSTQTILNIQNISTMEPVENVKLAEEVPGFNCRHFGSTIEEDHG